MNGTWLIPFQGRQSSCAIKQNFLWKNGNIYIMDNHRAALWCWLQEIDRNLPVNLYHIDAHYDCRNIAQVKWIKDLPDISSLTIDEYLKLSAGSGRDTYPVVLWDNFLSLFIELHGKNINELFTSTHLLGDKPNIHFEEVTPHNLPSFFRQYVVDEITNNDWIIDIDLDYFFCSQPEQLMKMFSTSYIEEIFGAVFDAYKSGRVAVLTICLSPECCGNWAQAEELCYLLSKHLKLDFQIPSAISQS